MIGNQIIACLGLILILAIMIFSAIVTGETYLIITSIVFGVLSLLFILQAIKIIKKYKGKKIKYDINYTIFIVIIIIGVFFSILSSLLIKNINYRKNGIETTATVYNIEKKVEYDKQYDADGNEYQEKQETCEVYITYEVNNKAYNNKLDMNSCNYSKGEKVNIYYQKDNPNKFINASKSNLIILIVGIVFCGSVLLYILYNLKKIGFKKAILNKK